MHIGLFLLLLLLQPLAGLREAVASGRPGVARGMAEDASCIVGQVGSDPSGQPAGLKARPRSSSKGRYLAAGIQLIITQAVIGAVGRCALSLDSADRPRSTLEESLYADVIPGVDGGVVPAVIGKALLQLHSNLQEGRDAQVSARKAIDEIRSDPEARMSCPVEALIAGLKHVAEIRQLAYTEAQHLASLPWSNLTSLVPNDVAVSADSYRIEVEVILHEVDEGFVDPGTTYPDVARSAASLASDLRRRVSQGDW